MKKTVFLSVAMLVVSDARTSLAQTFGADIGYAHQVEMLGHRQDTGKVKLAVAHLQMSGAVLPHLDLMFEWQFAQSIPTELHPSSRFIAGLNSLARFKTDVGKNRVAFFDAGVGISSLGIRVRELNGYLQYTLQAGAGMEVRPAKKRVGYFAQVRWTHFSNNDIAMPNEGLNFVALLVGVNLHPKAKP